MFNILLYSGIALIILGLILFVISQYKLRGVENEIDRQKKLHQSFIKQRLNEEAKRNIIKWKQ